MAYLGHEKGPRLSRILERNRAELLLKLRKYRGFGPSTILPETIQNIIEIEEQEEEKGIVASAKIPVGLGVNPGEFLYERIDYETNSGIELYYTLTEQEQKALGEDYKQEKVQVMSPEQARIQEAIREERMERGEVPFGAGD